MKSIKKVKRQRRIKNIPGYCDNRKSKYDLSLEELVRKGVIKITKPMPRRVDKSQLRRQVQSN